MNSKIITGDCIEVMKTMPENSVDAIITDPPYGLEFMGKDWDKFNKINSGRVRKENEITAISKGPDKYVAGVPFQTFTYNWSKEALRVLKPGGYLLSFGGTRTYHRMACAIEDAGFEIRDCIEWVYGSGFPKSLNIGKAVDKLQGNEREIWEEKRNGGGVKKGQAYEGGFETIAGIKECSKGTSEWEGYGTALKPSHEPIVVARKPLSEKTVAENVLKWGTGGINIDGCRVETSDILSIGSNNHKEASVFQTSNELKSNGQHNLGRFPANLIHDGSEEVQECFPDNKGAFAPVKFGQKGFGGVIYGKYKTGGDDGATFYEQGNLGNASRFFKTCEFTEEDFPAFYYCAKASKGERNCMEIDNSDKYNGKFPCSKADKDFKNNHPTVKPVKLMEYLVKLVAPEGSTVLDCFLGSGTTGVACAKLNRNFIGIELNPEYIEIAEKRLKPYLNPEQKRLEI